MSFEISDKHYTPLPTKKDEMNELGQRCGVERRKEKVFRVVFPIKLKSGNLVILERRLQPERRALLE